MLFNYRNFASAIALMLFITSCNVETQEPDKNVPKEDVSTSSGKDAELAKNLDAKISKLEKLVRSQGNDKEALLADLKELHDQRAKVSVDSVSINKELLGKDLLFHATFSSTAGAASPDSLRSKVVNIKKVGTKLIVTENLDTKLQTNDIPTEKLDLVLPIISENETSIDVDFSKGFNTFNYRLAHSEEDIALVIVDSYVKRSRTYSDNALALDIVIKEEYKGEVETGVLKVTFEPLETNENFKTTKASDLENQNIRFFTSESVWDPGKEKPEYLALKWDTTKEVVYHYSRNFPEEYLEVLQASIEYWNIALGKKVLKLKKLPEGVEPNDRGYNVIQWLSWDAAGSARADFKSNPRTGELLQATLHITSVFTKSKGLSDRLNDILKSGESDKPKKENKSKMSSMTSHETCSRDHISALKGVATHLTSIAADRSEEELKEIEKGLIYKYLAEVITHEIGHSMGLRHNFASSAQSEVKAQDYDPQIKSLIETDKLIIENVGTSSMEYTRFFDGVMLGHHIINGNVLSYDQKAIKFAYDGIPEKPSKEEKAILFCSDEEADSIIDDCRRFDRYKEKIYETYIESALGSIRYGESVAKAIYKGLSAGDTSKIDPVKNGEQLYSWYVNDLLASISADVALLSSEDAAKFKKDQIEKFDTKDGAIFDLINAMPFLFKQGLGAGIDGLPNDTKADKKTKDLIQSVSDQYAAIVENVFYSNSIKGLKGLNYQVSDAEQYVNAFTKMASNILKKDSGMPITKEGETENLITKPYYDLFSGDTLRIALVDMMANDPPLYSDKTFKVLMSEFKVALEAEQKEKIEGKFEAALKADPYNLDLIDQLNVENQILELLSLYW